MVKPCSLFSQLLKEVPREQFDVIVSGHQAEKHSKGFTCWTQFVSMLFCHLAKAESLREICNGLSCCLGKLNHLGVAKSPSRSTLSYANENRPSGVFKDLFWALLGKFRDNGMLHGGKKRFSFTNKLLSLDSSTITLCLTLFPWADYKTTKGGIKLHVLLDHDDYMPAFVHLTSANTADVKIAQQLNLIPGSIVVMDKAYNDYKLFSDWTDSDVFFVTRLKENTVYEVLRTETPTELETVLTDEIILLSDNTSRCHHPLRKVVYYDKEQNRLFTFLTNNMTLSAMTIADIYKDRWQIELFFKLIKQNLKIKTFVGTTQNALEIQIWTALIGLLLVKWLHYLSNARWSFANLFAMLRMSLFTHQCLRQWLDDPFGEKTKPPGNHQLELFIEVLDS